MKNNKSYIIWMPQNGSGKTHQFIINPRYLIALAITLLLCIVSIPFLEHRLYTLNRKIAMLEGSRAIMKTEIAELRYLKDNLRHIEKRDHQLSEYFGMSNNLSHMEGLPGRGGISDDSGFMALENSLLSMPSENGQPSHLTSLDERFKKYSELIKTREQILEVTPSILPVEKRAISLSSGFGWRENPFTKTKEFHAAIDISGDMGTKIYAPARGLVLKTGYDKRIGNFILIRHTDKIDTIYGHLSAVYAEAGKEVRRGERIGLMGNSGLSTGVHLHYMVIKEGRAVNPFEYILDMGDGL
jgi:murein DD-endopeptidase MepM/ murein hydrolase activator NlpD